MSAALELVKLALRAYGLGDPEIAVQLCHPLIRWDERASRPDGELVSGQDDVLRAMRSYQDGWESYRFEVEKIAEVEAGKIAGLCRERGVERQREGVAIDRRYGGLWLVEANKIASWSTHRTPAEAVRAAREPVPERLHSPAGAEAGAQMAVADDATAPEAAPPPTPPEPAGAVPVITRQPSQERGVAVFDEKQRAAAKRRAALSRAARERGRHTRTA